MAELVATSQTDRFHTEILSHNSRNVDLTQVTVTVGVNEVLSDAHLQLMHGVHYGLLGRNGVGKSCLLRAIGTGVLIGWPRSVSALYCAQEAAGEERTALEVVANSNLRKQRLTRELEELEEAQGDTAALAQAVADIRAEAAHDAAADADQVAIKRSGRRGLVARKAAIAATQHARDAAAVAQQLQLLQVDEAALQATAVGMMAERCEELAGMDVEADEAHAAEILAGLGFSSQQQRTPTQALSGGWRMRVALAVALFAEPDLLLLDEPTNHLDMEATIWLQEWLISMRGQLTLVVVSHDRAFLNAVSEEVILYKDKTLTYFEGNYDAFMEARELAALRSSRQAELLARKKAHMEESIAAMVRAAKSADGADDKRLAQVASRRKKIEERLGADKTADGRRFRLSKMGYSGMAKRPPVVLEAPEKPIVFDLPPPDDLRYSGPILQLREVTFSYPPRASDGGNASTSAPPSPSSSAAAGSSSSAGGPPASSSAQAPATPPQAAKRLVVVGAGRTPAQRPGLSKAAAKQQQQQRGAAAEPPPAVRVGPQPILDCINLNISAGSRIGLMGPNGAGKSTLLALLAGTLQPSSGTVERFSRLKVGMHSQHHVDKLQLPQTPLEFLQATHPHLRDQDVRDYLANFGLGGAEAVRPLASLSGGQKCRMSLALDFYAHPQVMLLDEPTNHLDLASIQALTEALRAWTGAIVVTSHDVHFLDALCGGEDGELYLVAKGKLQRYESAAAYAAKLRKRVLARRERSRANDAARHYG